MAKGSKQGEGPSRRDEILEAALQVIAERGIKGATVRDIGQAAGILSGSLYYHFESKEQIVVELLLPSLQEQYDRSVEVRDAATTALEALTELVRLAVLNTARRTNQSLILRNEARTFAELPALAPVNELRGKMLALWLDAVKRGIKTGEFRSDVDADVVVRAMFDGVLGAARWFGGQRRIKPERVAASLIDLYVTGLAAD